MHIACIRERTRIMLTIQFTPPQRAPIVRGNKEVGGQRAALYNVRATNYREPSLYMYWDHDHPVVYRVHRGYTGSAWPVLGVHCFQHGQTRRRIEGSGTLISNAKPLFISTTNQSRVQMFSHGLKTN